MKKYRVAVPYYLYFQVEADSEEEAIEKARNIEGQIGQPKEVTILVEEPA